MARAPIPSKLLGPNGKPAAYYFFEGGARRWQDTIPLWYWSGARDTNRVLPTYTWKQLMICGRFLFANVPMLRGAVIEQANYAFPLERHYVGEDQEWGEEAGEWLREWDKNCTFRGAPFDAEMVSRMRLFGSVVDGDIETVMAADPDSGIPKIQLVRAHRVGDRMNSQGNGLEEGPFKGYQIENGIITNRVGTMLAFCMLGDDSDDDEYVSLTGSPGFPAGVMMFRPTYSDQVRGITELVASINSFDDVKRLNEYEMRAQEAMSSIGIIEKNETGFADETADAILRPTPPDPTNTPGTATGLITETYEAGLVRYFRSGTGSGLEAFRGDRPSADAANFEARIVSRAFYGIEWDPNFALMLKEPGGAWARITLTKVNRRLSRIQATEAKVKHRTDIHALSHAIYSLGTLKAPKNGDIFSWGYRGPARITADSGNEATAKRNDYICGLRTMQMHCIEEGRDWRHVRRQNLVEKKGLFADARELLKEVPELGNIQAAAKWLEDHNPNSTPAPTPAGPGEEDATQPAGKQSPGRTAPDDPEEDNEEGETDELDE